MPTARRRHAVTETPRVQAALLSLPRAAIDEAVERRGRRATAAGPHRTPPHAAGRPPAGRAGRAASAWDPAPRPRRRPDRGANGPAVRERVAGAGGVTLTPERAVAGVGRTAFRRRGGRAAGGRPLTEQLGRAVPCRGRARLLDVGSPRDTVNRH